jgi:hypothetical protein
MAAKYNLTIDQGATFERLVRVSEANAPKDLTGYVVRAQLRRSYKAALPLATFVCAVTDAAAGEITLTLDATTTTGITAGAAVWDLELEYAGVVTRLLEGTVQITPEVTR